MISALAGSHILHINSASVCELLSQPNRPTSTVTNKHTGVSQMVWREALCLFPGYWREGAHVGPAPVRVPRASGSCNAVCKQAPLKKNVNEGAIHYLGLAHHHPLLLWARPALGTGKASDESRATLEAWSHGKADSSLLLRILQAQHFLAHKNSWAFHFLPNKALEFFLCLYQGCLYTTYTSPIPRLPPKKADLLLYSQA